ncbi:MAG: hypothetical protein ACR2OB_01015 [Solirubrobacteraceae bacterium]
MHGRETLAVVGVGAVAVVCCAGVPAVLAFVGGVTLVGLLGGGLLAIVLIGCAALLMVRSRRRRCVTVPQHEADA